MAYEIQRPLLPCQEHGCVGPMQKRKETCQDLLPPKSVNSSDRRDMNEAKSALTTVLEMLSACSFWELSELSVGSWTSPVKRSNQIGTSHPMPLIYRQLV
eukprot:779884-Amphidinium_carterae.1